MTKSKRGDTFSPKRRETLRLLGGGAMALGFSASPVLAQERYPSRPIELIVSFGAGGSSDIFYRSLATIASRYLNNQKIVVINRPGAGSAIGTGVLKRAKPDGYTLGNITEVMMREQLLGNGPYDPKTDFTYIAATAAVVFGWGVRRDSPIRNLTQLVDEGKKSPEKLSYASAGSALLPSWAMKVLEHRTGARFLGVPYAGSAQVLLAGLGGQVDVICDALGAMASAVPNGSLRMLAVSSEERLRGWPTVPTAREQGIDATTTLPYGLGGPAGMPSGIIETIHDAFRKASLDPEHQALVERLNMIPWYRGPKEFDAYMQAQYAEMPALMRAFGLTLAR